VALLAGLLFTACSRRIPMDKGASWDRKSGTFVWIAGQVKLPAGFSYQVDQGTDTFEGHFTSRDKRLIIRHDIGGYAGAWASSRNATKFQEREVQGARVWTATHDWPDGKGGKTKLVGVTFPDSGCANFFVKSSEPRDADAIATIADSFQPRGEVRRSGFCR
jgi:hypothetical protein